MSLTDKYARLVQYAQESGAQNLTATEQEGVLYVTASATASTKDRMWAIYNEIDPEMRSGDLVLKVEVIAGGEEIYEVKGGDNLSKIASKYPGMTWQKIFDANKDQLKDPNMIHPGQKLRIPL